MSIELGARLAELRKQNGYSQESLAEKVGISRQAVSKWERGESSPDTDTLIALAKLYDISLDGLIDHKPASSKANDTAASYASADYTDKENASARNDQNSVPLYPGLKAKLLKFPLPIFVTALYIISGFMFRLWHPMWIIFLFIPVYYKMAFAVNAATKKSFLLRLPVIMLSIILFLILGFAIHAWKWAWILFILDAFYYWYIPNYIK